MIGKFIISTALVSSLWCTTFDKNTNKFLVVDTKTFNKIKKLNVLNGGIKTNYVIKSKNIDDETMQKYYPELFAYSGEKCYSIQNVFIYKSKDKKLPLKKEIEKLRILNILHNTENDYKTINKLDMQTIQAIGIICNGKLHLRNKDYKIGDNIYSNYYIKSIDQNMANVILGVQ